MDSKNSEIKSRSTLSEPRNAISMQVCPSTRRTILNNTNLFFAGTLTEFGYLLRHPVYQNRDVFKSINYFRETVSHGSEKVSTKSQNLAFLRISEHD